MPELGQMFGFEKSAVVLPGGLFRPLVDAVGRWGTHCSEMYDWLGTRFRILYDLKDGRFVLLEYGCCSPKKERHQDRVVDVWYSDQPPCGTEISPEAAAVFLLKNNLDDIPSRLDSVVERLLAPPPVPPVRPMSHWSGRNLLSAMPRPSAHTVDVLELLPKLVDRSIRFLQEIKAGSIQRSHGRSMILQFSQELFATYAVEPAHWWGSASEFPPAAVPITRLRWPPNSDGAREAVNSLQASLEGALVVLSGRLYPQDIDFPTMQEHRAAEHYLLGQLSEFESMVLRLRSEAEKLRKADHDQPAAAKVPSPRPTDEQFRLYFILIATGMTQSEAASVYTQQTRLPMTQGQVSRAKATVEAWLADGNKLPRVSPPEIDSIEATDPKKLEMGRNMSGRTRRQRGKSDE